MNSLKYHPRRGRYLVEAILLLVSAMAVRQTTFWQPVGLRERALRRRCAGQQGLNGISECDGYTLHVIAGSRLAIVSAAWFSR